MMRDGCKTAVVGAGLAGLECARRLAAAGRDVVVFDKGRGPGGRCTTRRHENAQFDHGAQYFTARDPEFLTLVEELLGRGVLAHWQPRLVVLCNGVARELEGQPDRFVGVPAMSALPKALATNLEVLLDHRVLGLERGPAGWRIEDETGRHPGEFATVVLALPPEQAGLLVPPFFAARFSAVQMAPCLSLLLNLPEDLERAFDAAFIEDDRVLSWIARDGSKPGRPRPTTWVVQAQAEFSRRHFDGDDEDIAQLMIEALKAQLRASPQIRVHELKRWRYAIPQSETLAAPLYDSELALGVCGDWCRGGRIEGAWQSGRDLAAAILAG